MTTVTIGISDIEQEKQRLAAAFQGHAQGSFLTFASVDLMWKTLTPRRWELLQSMTGQGPLSLRAVSRLVGRDVKTVHQDAHALLDAGLLEKTENNRLVFRYDAIHVDFTITKAA